MLRMLNQLALFTHSYDASHRLANLVVEKKLLVPSNFNERLPANFWNNVYEILNKTLLFMDVKINW